MYFQINMGSTMMLTIVLLNIFVAEVVCKFCNQYRIRFIDVLCNIHHGAIYYYSHDEKWNVSFNDEKKRIYSLTISVNTTFFFQKERGMQKKKRNGIENAIRMYSMQTNKNDNKRVVFSLRFLSLLRNELASKLRQTVRCNRHIWNF